MQSVRFVVATDLELMMPAHAGGGNGQPRAALAALKGAWHAWWRGGAPAMACERSHAIT